MAIIGFTHTSPIEAAALGTNVVGSCDTSPRAYHTAWNNETNAPGKSEYDGMERFGPFAMWTYHTHVGVCLRDFERNGYDDSDFYMVVWNEEKFETETICFASTRGWSYPSYGSFVDATPEVRQKLEGYERALEIRRLINARKQKATERCDFRRVARLLGAEHDFPAYRVYKLLKLYDAAKVHSIVKLLTSKRLTSGFKLSLRARVIEWLKTERPAYNTPLSAKQADCL